MRIVDFSIRRPVTVLIGAIAAVVFGVVAFGRLATDLLPDITYPSLTVRTVYEGTAPQEVETLVTRPVENAVGVVNNVVRVSSSSRTDISEVTLELGWDTDMDLAALDVRERLDVLVLPPDADRPLLLRYDPSLDPILRIGLTGSGSDLVHLRRLAEERVQRSLERIEGVAAVLVSGGLEEEIQVEIDDRRLAALGISAEDVVQRLAQENVNLTGGRLREGRTEFLVRTVNELLRPEDLEQVLIASLSGAPVRLRDVARVVKGHVEREIISRIDGREAVEVAVYKEGGTNTVAVSDRVREGLGAIESRLRELDPGTKLTVVSDQARFIRQSVAEVLQTALWGGLLAVGVLYLFLRSLKTTIIIGVAIPISVVSTFFLMFVSGISLNIMSLGGLTLGIGLLVDNAIVVLEAIQRRRDAGLDPVAAASSGAGEVARAVVSSTLTTICVFVPIVFVEGVAGQLFGDQALTVTYSLAVSLLVALTLIPMLASRRSVDADEEAAPSGLALRVGVGVARAVWAPVRIVAEGVGRVMRWPADLFLAGQARLAGAYSRLLRSALTHPWRTLALASALFAASLLLIPGLGSELIPELIQGELFVDAQLPPGTRLEVTDRYLARIEGLVSEAPGVRTVYGLVGASNEQGGTAGERRENIGQVAITLEPPTSREREERLMDGLRVELDRQEGLEYRFGRPSYFSFRTPVEIEIRGYNLELLERLADRALASFREIPGLVDLRSSTEGGSPELRIFFDRERLASLGIDLSVAAGLLRSKIQGTVATEIQREDRTIDIRLRAAESDRDSVEDIENLIVHQEGEAAIPLSAVARVTEEEGPAEIRRAEGERVAVITANIEGRDLASVTGDLVSILESLEMPAGYDWRIGGQRQEMETSFRSLRLAISLAVFMVYLVMASQFESLMHPFVILFSVPFALVGVLATLAVTETRVSVVVLIGAVLLAGIVVNNAILLVDTTNRLRREGVATVPALQRAGELRLRPILMTTSTTVLGLLPMAIGLGEGSELRRPMALTVIGGLLTSTLLTLLIVPAVYRLLSRPGPLAEGGTQDDG